MEIGIALVAILVAIARSLGVLMSAFGKANYKVSKKIMKEL